jgi:ubiquinone/menaquinone biosynthesis C-methylase UbiE
MKKNNLNNDVRNYWEKEPCGTNESIVKETIVYSLEYYESIEKFRYDNKPCIHSIAQFTRRNKKKVLEIGVGAGTDHLQWARAGAILSGVDLTDASIKMTCNRLKLYGFTSNLLRCDAEDLPFEDQSYDIVYSWGVIHHSENPQIIISEINRILKSEGEFIGMFYHRRSLVTLRVWFRHALLNATPWLSFSKVLYNHMESIGTKAYSRNELIKMFSQFKKVEIVPFLTPYDIKGFPNWLSRIIPQQFGWFYGIRAVK